MFQRKRRFRRRVNGRSNMSHSNSSNRMRPNSFTNGQSRNNFRQSLSAEKLFEKYSLLAKEAMTSGDKTLSENYLQHADHFIRVIEDRNRNRSQIQDQSNIVKKQTENTKEFSSAENNNQAEEIKKKE